MAFDFMFGAGTGQSYDQLNRRRKIADDLAAQIMGKQPKNAAEGIGALLSGAAAGIGRYQADQGIKEGRGGASALFDSILSKMTGQPASGASPATAAASMPMPGAAGEMAASSPTANVSKNGSTFSPFIDTVKAGGLTNPYGLAAVASTGRAESGWSPENAARTWSDPSESGQAGMAGGVMSWRAERLANLRRYAASKGEQGNGSPQTQGEFFMQEDPQLIARLNAAKSTDEAQSIINGAWKFAGYNRPGGEAGRRLGYANGYVSQFQGGGSQVASLDPSAGMSPAAAAIEAQAPGSGAVVPPPFDDGRWNDPIKLSEMPAGPGDMAQRLQTQREQYAPRGAPMQPQAMLPVGGAPPQAPQAGPLQTPQQQSQAPQMAQNAPSLSAQPYRIDPQIIQFLSSPFADEGQKQAMRLYLQNDMQQHQDAQEERTWRARQEFAAQQKQSDPAYQAGLEQTRVTTQRLRDGTRPITAEERRQWGIPATDQRPYAMVPGEGPKLIGSSGQTINIGGQLEERKKAAEAMGLKTDDPRYLGYVLNGELPKENQQNLTAVDKKAIQDADDMVAANQNALQALTYAEKLSPEANSGWFAGTRASIGNNLPDWIVPDFISSPKSSQATTDMDNAIVGQALNQLKTIFGGNPTEGERAILLQLQGSSSMPEAVRKQVFARARDLAEKRLKYNQDRANDLRGGNYYKPTSASATKGQAAAPNVDDLLKKYGGQ